MGVRHELLMKREYSQDFSYDMIVQEGSKVLLEAIS